MSSTRLEVRPLVERDLAQVTRIHCAAFPEGAITRLGAGAAERYYRWLLLGPHQALCIGAFMGEALAGYCFGGIFRGATSGFLHKYRYYLMRQVIIHPWLAFNPFFRQRLKEGLNGLLRARQYTEATIEERRRKKNTFSLLSIATDPTMQKRGIGGTLMRRAEEYAIEQGYQRMSLTVHGGNLGGFNFYASHGWHVEQELGENTIMAKTLTQGQAGSVGMKGASL